MTFPTGEFSIIDPGMTKTPSQLSIDLSRIIEERDKKGFSQEDSISSAAGNDSSRYSAKRSPHERRPLEESLSLVSVTVGAPSTPKEGEGRERNKKTPRQAFSQMLRGFLPGSRDSRSEVSPRSKSQSMIHPQRDPSTISNSDVSQRSSSSSSAPPSQPVSPRDKKGLFPVDFITPEWFATNGRDQIAGLHYNQLSKIKRDLLKGVPYEKFEKLNEKQWLAIIDRIDMIVLHTLLTQNTELSTRCFSAINLPRKNEWLAYLNTITQQQSSSQQSGELSRRSSLPSFPSANIKDIIGLWSDLGELSNRKAMLRLLNFEGHKRIIPECSTEEVEELLNLYKLENDQERFNTTMNYLEILFAALSPDQKTRYFGLLRDTNNENFVEALTTASDQKICLAFNSIWKKNIEAIKEAVRVREVLNCPYSEGNGILYPHPTGMIRYILKQLTRKHLGSILPIMEKRDLDNLRKGKVLSQFRELQAYSEMNEQEFNKMIADDKLHPEVLADKKLLIQLIYSHKSLAVSRETIEQLDGVINMLSERICGLEKTVNTLERKVTCLSPRLHSSDEDERDDSLSAQVPSSEDPSDSDAND